MAKRKTTTRGRRGWGCVDYHRGAWRARFPLGGGKHREARFVGPESDSELRDDAHDWLALQRTKVRHGKLEVPEPPKVAPDRTLDELAVAYTFEMVELPAPDRDPWRAGTLRHFNGHFNSVISPAFGDRIASTITSEELRQFLALQLGRPILHQGGEHKGKPSGRVVTRATLAQYHSVLRKLFRWAASHGPEPGVPWLKVNPMVGVKRYKVPKKAEPRWLRPAELRAILAAAVARAEEAAARCAFVQEKGHRRTRGAVRALWRARRDVAFFTVLIFTGLRAEELAQWRWRWVDFERGLLDVQHAKVGDHRPDQRVTLSPRALAALKAWAPQSKEALRAAADHFVFPGFERGSGPKAERSPTVKLSPSGMRRPLRDLLKAAKVDPAGIGLHAFRHTFITLLDQAGVRPRVKQALARHVDGSMTDHYTHQDFEDQAEALQRLEAQVLHELRVVQGNFALGGAR